MAHRVAQHYPAAVRVARELQQRIASGHYASDAWLPTERALAEEFRVSRPVIRAALSDLTDLGLVTRRPGCRPVVAPGHAATARPAHGARRPARPAVRSIAVVLPQHPTYASAQAILRGVTSAIQVAGAPHHVAVYDTHPSADRGDGEVDPWLLERDALARIALEGADGVVLWTFGGRETEAGLARLRDVGIPVVFIDRCPSGAPCDFVGVDNRTGMRLAVEYLLGLGHHRIGYVTIADPITTVQDREAGYHEALAAAGLAFAPNLVFCTPASMGADLSAAVEHFLTLSRRPTAVAALNDLHAFAFIREAAARGWRVPDEVSVIGFDDIESYSPHPGMLTSVHQPFQQLGSAAADLLLRRLAAPAGSAAATHQHIILPASLVVRSTCRPAVAAAPA